MRKQIFIHGSDMDSLHKHIDKGHLPKKYGGEMPEFPYTAWMANLAKNDRVMDELKRLGKYPLNVWSIFKDLIGFLFIILIIVISFYPYELGYEFDPDEFTAFI